MVNPKRNTSRHIVLNRQKIKDKERILKAAREKQNVAHKEIPISSGKREKPTTKNPKQGFHSDLIEK